MQEEVVVVVVVAKDAWPRGAVSVHPPFCVCLLDCLKQCCFGSLPTRDRGRSPRIEGCSSSNSISMRTSGGILFRTITPIASNSDRHSTSRGGCSLSNYKILGRPAFHHWQNRAALCDQMRTVTCFRKEIWFAHGCQSFDRKGGRLHL